MMQNVQNAKYESEVTYSPLQWSNELSPILRNPL